MKTDLGTHLGDSHGHLFLGDLELVWTSFKVRQTKVENMKFCLPIWEISVDTYFLWDSKLFWPWLMVCKTKIENMRFCRLCWNWNFKIDLDVDLRDEHGHLFLWDLELIYPSFKVGQNKVENIHFFLLSWNWVLKVDYVPNWEISMDLFYKIWTYFGPHPRLVKPRLKIWTFVNFLEIEF